MYSVVCAARSARSMRTTKALGTSWTRRAETSATVKLDGQHVRRRRGAQDSAASASVVTTRISRRGDLDLLAEDLERGQRGRRHHLVHGLAHGAELELGELGALGRRAASSPIMEAASRRAPSTGSRKTLPPVTPST